MKTIKILASIFMMFIFTGVVAQDKGTSRMKKTKTTKSYEYKKDGKTIPYRVTVFKSSETPIVFTEETKDTYNKNLKDVPAQVTKLIYVDNDMWSDYDKYIVLKYPKEGDDSFELKATDRGFMVVVDKHNVEYIFGEGLYFVNNTDRDFFLVDEFDSI